MNRLTTTILLGLALTFPALAAAQTQAPTATGLMKPGAVIYDTAGAVAGTVASVTADTVLVDTGANKIAIPPSSFGATDKGLLLAATKAQLDAAAVQAAADARAKVVAMLVPGAEVHGAGGTPVGNVKALEADLVLVTTPKGDVRLPSAAFATGPSGLIIGMTAAEFDAAVSAATATPPAGR